MQLGTIKARPGYFGETISSGMNILRTWGEIEQLFNPMTKSVCLCYAEKELDCVHPAFSEGYRLLKFVDRKVGIRWHSILSRKCGIPMRI